MEELDLFVKSPGYNEVVGLITRQKRIKVTSDYYGVLLEDASEHLEKASLTSREIEALLNSEEFIKYVIARIDTIGPHEEEFPEGEEIGTEEVATTDEDHGFSIFFLVDDLIEFYILKYRPAELEGYLKSIGIPFSKKVATHLRHAFLKKQ